MKITPKHAARTMTLLALMLSLVLAFSAPVYYLITNYEHKSAVLETEADAAAAFISVLISSNPAYWQYAQPRLEDFLLRLPFDKHDEQRRIVDQNNVVLARNDVVLDPPLLTRSRPLYDSGRIVAHVEISRSLRPILFSTLGIALFSLAFGAGFFYLFKVYPLRSLDEALQALQESEKKFRDLFNNAEVGMFRSRLDESELLDMNRKYLDIVGRSYEELKGKPSVTLWADPREREDMVRRLVADGSVSDFECKMLNKKTGVRNCLTSSRFYPVQGILEGSIIDITERKRAEEERELLFNELSDALSNIKTLKGMLPICASCKKIRDDKGYWSQVETYISTHTDTVFSHGICPDCVKKVHEELEKY